jgi:uncharacterized protein (TIGR02996 family)
MDHVEELEAAVGATLDDDGPRAVLADALIERGDPRGEMIALSLAAARRPLTKAMQTRLDELARMYWKSWPAWLWQWVKFPKLRRGFLAECEVSRHGPLEKLVGDRRWATVERIKISGDRGERRPPVSPHVAEFLAHETMQALRIVRGIEPRELEQLCDEPRPLALDELLVERSNVADEGEVSLVRVAERFPKLVRFETWEPPTDYAPLFSSLGDWLDYFEAPIGDRGKLALRRGPDGRRTLDLTDGHNNPVEWMLAFLDEVPPTAIASLRVGLKHAYADAAELVAWARVRGVAQFTLEVYDWTLQQWRPFAP